MREILTWYDSLRLLFFNGIDRFPLQLPENAELTWDDGSPYPEPCLDNVAPMVGKVRHDVLCLCLPTQP